LNKKYFMMGMMLFSVATSAEVDTISTTISQAIGREDATVKVSYIASVKIQDGNVAEARRQALESALQELIRISTEHLVPQDRLEEVKDLVERKIYQKARVFILSFQPLKSMVVEDEYQLPLDVTIHLKALQKALIDHKILFMDYSRKELRLVGLYRFKDYQFLKEALEKELHGLKRIVEGYQKEGEMRLWIEATSTLDQIFTFLNTIKNKEGAPSFTAQVSPVGSVIDVTFIK